MSSPAPLLFPVNVSFSDTMTTATSFTLRGEGSQSLVLDEDDTLNFTIKNLLGTSFYRNSGNISLKIERLGIEANSGILRIKADEALEATVYGFRDVLVDLGRAEDNSSVSVAQAQNTSVKTGQGDDQILVIAQEGDALEGKSFHHIATSSGDDEVQIESNGFLHAMVRSGRGYDTITFQSEYVVHGQSVAATDSLIAYGGSGDDFIIGSDGKDFLHGQQGDDVLLGQGGRDRIFGGSGDDEIYGGNDADRLYGQNGDDFLGGGRGNDRIWGGRGDDELYGDEGRDVLYGQQGNDRLSGGGGNDRIFGGLGDDYLDGGEGNDRLYGQNGEDRLFGQNGNDRIYGGRDNDEIEGGDGSDRLYGQAGDDYIVFDGLDQIISGGSGNDTALYDNRSYQSSSNRTVDINPELFRGIEFIDFSLTPSEYLELVTIDINDVLEISDTAMLRLDVSEGTSVRVENFDSVQEGQSRGSLIYSSDDGVIEVILSGEPGLIF